MSSAATEQAKRYYPPSSTHPVDEVLPTGRLITLGLQHLVIMYASAIAVPIIVGDAIGLPQETIALLVNADLLLCGIFTIVQSVGVFNILGVRLPVVTGATFTIVSPMIIIGQHYGMQSVYGAMLVSGIFGILLAKPFAKLIRFFPPLVAGSVIAVIGLSLIGADVGLIAGFDPSAPDFGKVSNIALAGFVMLVVILISKFAKGLLNQLAVLLSIVIGTIVAFFMGITDFSGVANEPWIGFTGFWHFGTPEFDASAIIAMCLVMLVTFTESTADMIAVGDVVGKEVDEKSLSNGLMADAVSAFAASFLNSFPDTTFAQNVGLVGMTKIASRFVAAVCGVFLIILGLIPKMGALIASLPDPVIGGAATVMFAMVAAVGIQQLSKADLHSANNLLIIAFALAAGLLPSISPNLYQQFPESFQVIFGSGITSSVIVAFSLNLLFNHIMVKKEDQPEGT